MSGYSQFRWFLLASIVVALLVVVTSPVSWAGKLEDAQKKVPLAITEFVFKGYGTDSTGLGKEARSILEKDLRLSGLFSPLRKPVFEELERMEWYLYHTRFL